MCDALPESFIISHFVPGAFSDLRSFFGSGGSDCGRLAGQAGRHSTELGPATRLEQTRKMRNIEKCFVVE